MKVILLLFLIFDSNTWAKEPTRVTKTVLELSMMADSNCFNVQLLGPCPRPNRDPPIGIKIRFWQPEVFIETVKMPGDYTVVPYGPMLQSLAKQSAKTELETITSIRPLIVTSGGSFNSLSNSGMQFNEVHLYDVPSDLAFDELCSGTPNATLGIRYLSEADSITWRKGNIEKDLPQSMLAAQVGPQCHHLRLGATPAQCMKSWGPLYPRQGFVISPNEPVGSIIDGVRAVSIAGNPLPDHVVESPLDFQPNIPIDKVQMVYPVKTSCFPIGQNPAEWEKDKQSKDGHYVWIFWHRRQCCASY